MEGAPKVESRTILVVEDEDLVRDVTLRVLRRAGFTVLSANDSREAMVVAERLDQPIHLLVTDVVMPDVSGPELVEMILRIRPGLQVLFVSGYPSEDTVRLGVNLTRHSLVHKPYSPAELVASVKTALGDA